MITSIKIQPGKMSGSLDTNSRRFGGSVKTNYRVGIAPRADGLPWMPLSLYTDAVASSVGPHEIPVRYQAYSLRDISGGTPAVIDADTGLYARDIVIKPGEDYTKFWDIDVTWRPLDPGQSPGDADVDPLTRPARYWLEFQEQSRIVETAWNLDEFKDPTDAVTRAADTLAPITNTAGQDYDEPIHETDQLVIVAMEKNYATLQTVLDIHNTYHRTLNSNGSFFGAAPMHARFEGITTGQPENESGVQFWRGVTRVAFSKTPFVREIVNRGWQYYDAGGALKKWDGAEPVLLAANGKRLGDGLVGNNVRYRTRELVDYTGVI